MNTLTEICLSIIKDDSSRLAGLMNDYSDYAMEFMLIAASIGSPRCFIYLYETYNYKTNYWLTMDVMLGGSFEIFTYVDNQIGFDSRSIEASYVQARLKGYDQHVRYIENKYPYSINTFFVRCLIETKMAPYSVKYVTMNSLSCLFKMWIMEERSFKNYIQWLPTEVHEDLLEMLTPQDVEMF